MENMSVASCGGWGGMAFMVSSVTVKLWIQSEGNKDNLRR